MKTNHQNEWKKFLKKSAQIYIFKEQTRKRAPSLIRKIGGHLLVDNQIQMDRNSGMKLAF
jgi:hypothetical protein